jgi:muramoyltetrapeptide carboxypeptidase
MVAGVGRIEPPLFERWVRAVEGEPPARVSGLTAIARGRAHGTLLGGNLTVLCALLATPFVPPLEGAVLFLEDTSERPYRVDRMLTTLLHTGLLSGVRAIVLGTFTRAQPGNDGVTVESVLAERLGALGVPVVAGVPAGHVDDNLELPFGATAFVDADRAELAFEEP